MWAAEETVSWGQSKGPLEPESLELEPQWLHSCDLCWQGYQAVRTSYLPVKLAYITSSAFLWWHVTLLLEPFRDSWPHAQGHVWGPGDPPGGTLPVRAASSLLPVWCTPDSGQCVLPWCLCSCSATSTPRDACRLLSALCRTDSCSSFNISSESPVLQEASLLLTFPTEAKLCLFFSLLYITPSPCLHPPISLTEWQSFDNTSAFSLDDQFLERYLTHGTRHY